MSERPNLNGVDVVLRRVSAQPANRSLHIIELRWPPVFAPVQQAVVDRYRNKSPARQEISHSSHRAFVKAHPAAAVDQYDSGTRLGTGLGWLVDIEQQFVAALHSIFDILLERDLIR